MVVCRGKRGESLVTGQPEALADLAAMRDPVAARLGRRALEGEIHMLEAQIAQLSELARVLRERERELESAAASSGEAQTTLEGSSDDDTRS